MGSGEISEGFKEKSFKELTEVFKKVSGASGHHGVTKDVLGGN